MEPKIKKEYYLNGNIAFEYHYLNGKRHREDGPAYIDYYNNGNIRYEIYYINNKRLTKSEWLIHCRKRKLKTL